MRSNVIKVMMGVIVVGVFGLAGCGGGGESGGSSAYDYSKISGKYFCNNMITNTFVASYQLEFTSNNLKSTTILTQAGLATNQVQDLNDYIGTQNGYPLYTEKVAGSSTESIGMFFSLPGNDGVPTLYMTRGLTDDVQKGNISLNTYSCKK